MNNYAMANWVPAWRWHEKTLEHVDILPMNITDISLVSEKTWPEEESSSSNSVHT